MIKYFLLILLFFSIVCNQIGPLEKYAEDYTKDRVSEDPNQPLKLKDELTKQYLFALGIPKFAELSYFNYCRLYSKLPNPAFFSAAYGEAFKKDVKQYKILILGDSTMDISTKYPKWYDKSKTQSLAVSGNTLCDVIEQTKVINSTDPKFIIIATNGGNDLLRGLSETEVLQNAGILHVMLRERFPNSKQVWIGIHPTLTEGNTIKNRINEVVSWYIVGTGNYYINPLFLFTGVCPTCKPPRSMMIDDIHYNAQISYELKTVIEYVIGEDI